MTQTDPATVPEADPAAIQAIAAELAARQTQREAEDLEKRAAIRAARIARMGEIRASAMIGLRDWREKRRAEKAARKAERLAVKAHAREEAAALKEKLRALPRPRRDREPAIPVALPRGWKPAHVNLAVHLMLNLCSKDADAYDLARAVKDAVILAYPDDPQV